MGDKKVVQPVIDDRKWTVSDKGREFQRGESCRSLNQHTLRKQRDVERYIDIVGDRKANSLKDIEIRDDKVLPV